MFRCVFPDSKVEYDVIFFDTIIEAMDYADNQLEDCVAIISSNDVITHLMKDFIWIAIH